MRVQRQGLAFGVPGLGLRVRGDCMQVVLELGKWFLLLQVAGEARSTISPRTVSGKRLNAPCVALNPKTPTQNLHPDRQT